MFFIRDFDNLNSKLNYFYLYWKKFAVDVIKSSQSSVLLPILFFTICNISTSNHLKNGWISVDNCLWFTIVNLCAWLQGTSKLANVSDAPATQKMRSLTFSCQSFNFNSLPHLVTTVTWFLFFFLIFENFWCFKLELRQSLAKS